EGVKQSYVKRGYPAEKIATCRYGIDTEAFPFIQRAPAENRHLRIAIVGVIGFRKGLYRLLKIGDWAQKNGLDIELHFAGPIQDLEAHEMFAASRAKVV